MPSLLTELYEKLYRIRYTEEKIRALYFDDEMKTPVHLSVGEEGIVAGVMQALQPDVHSFGTFRSHALYLASAGETGAFFRELYGRQSDIADGRAGSMHLSHIPSGLMCVSAVVASAIPLAVGDAFANRYKNKDTATVCFLGDGAVEEGVFWESLNAACVMHLPVLFVYEDNGLAIHADFSTRKGYRSFADIARQYDCLVRDTGTCTDALGFHDSTKELYAAMRSEGKPGILCARYYRHYEHVGVSEDFDAGYRSREDFEQWDKKDPVSTFRQKLTEAEALAIEGRIGAEVDASVTAAQKAPFAPAETLLDEVYAEVCK